MYEERHFMGDEQFFYGHAPILPVSNFGRSIVVTGCSPWTVYT